MNRKSKMVSFRVPYAEYLRLQQSCSVTGVRNISELARAAMQRMMQNPHPTDASLKEQVASLRLKIAALTTELDRIASKIP